MASDTTDYSNAANFHKVRAAVLHIRHTIWNIWNHNSTDVRFLASLDGHVHFMCTLWPMQCWFRGKKKNENPRCYGWRVGDLGGQNDDCHHQSAARQRGAQYPLEGYPSRIPKKSLEYLVRMSNYVKLYFSGQDVKQYYDGIMMVLWWYY